MPSSGRASVAARALVVLTGLPLAACATSQLPPQTVAPTVAPASIEQKVAWTLRLEQQRILSDATADAATPGASAPAPAGTAAPVRSAPGAAAPTPEAALRPATAPDLRLLVRDTDAAIRARAALAIGRVGLPDGISSLTAALRDGDADVRASAAFGLGLIGHAEALPALQEALTDAAPLVRARAIEALGLIANAAAAPAISQAAAGCGPVLAPLEPDDDEWPKTPEIEICRHALFALVRVRDYGALAQVALDANGAPVSRWWPVAYALQRVNDPRGVPALRSLATVPGVYTAGFALRGLAAQKDESSAALATRIAAQADADVKLRIAAIRLLGVVGGAAAAEPLLRLLGESADSTNLAIEIIAALGAIGDASVFDSLVDLMRDSRAPVRAAALAAAAKLDPEGFLLVLSGYGRDPDWTVRAALAPVLATLPADRVVSAIEELVADEDARVQAPALRALVAVKAPSAARHVLAALESGDYVVRGAAARLLGELKPDGGVAALEAALTRAQNDPDIDARAAALEGLAKYGGPEVIATLKRALADRDWPVRLRVAELLRELGDLTAVPERPAPVRQPTEFFSSPDLLRPTYSPHAFIETAHGVIEVQLNVVEAAVTTATFIEQARAGFFNGLRVHRLVPTFVVQAGDPRGDGAGGPGYTQRDELSALPFRRGTIGMALSWKDTAGSQWFIALSPQPHLDAKYTVFGQVVRGWDVLDRIAAWDVIDRVRIWDGVAFR
jgi:HEAT repeat protein